MAGPALQDHPLLIGAAVVLVVALALQRFFTIQYPSNLPRVGGGTRFSLQTRLRYYTDALGLYKEAYENYSKKGKTVLVPGLGFNNDIILPTSALRWLQRQPERLVSATAAQTETIQSHYGLGHNKFTDDPWSALLVKTDLNVILETVCTAMNEELGIAVDDHFGTDTSAWKEVDLNYAVRMIVAQAASRFTLGDSPLGIKLCRDKEGYLKESLAFADALVVNAGLGRASPKLLRPILGRFGGMAAQRQIRIVEKYFKPLYLERMRMLEEEEERATAGADRPSSPQDHLQIMLRHGLRERRAEALSVRDMTKRLSITNFGSMHQTSIQVVNMLLNIIESDPEFDTIAVLRDEVSRIVGDDDKTGWNKTRIAAMTRTDSVARETLRLYNFSTRNVTRKIVADGVVTEDGIALPKGSSVSLISYYSQTDGDMFDEPFKYDPFRFSRAREAASTGDGDAQKAQTKLANLSFVSTGLQSLAFSHGKHACPGRFLVDFELKMIVAYVLTRYDIDFPLEYAGVRPPNVMRAETCVPPDGVRIRVERRERKA